MITAKDLLKEFCKHYQDKVGERYPPTWGRDIKLFGDMLKLYDGERIIRLLGYYFDIPRKIYSIPFFKVALADLIQIEVKENAMAPKPMIDNESWRFA